MNCHPYLRNFSRFLNLRIERITISTILTGILCGIVFSLPLFADVKLPSVQDPTSQMEGAAILVKYINTGLFEIAARILAGICLLSAGWNLKEMRFGPALLCVVSAILFGTAPLWVNNIFNLTPTHSVFSQLNLEIRDSKFIEEMIYA